MKEEGYSWIPWSAHQGAPPGGVLAATTKQGFHVYVGRAFHDKDLLPAIVIPDLRVAYVSYKGKEYAKKQFEILQGTDFTWDTGDAGSVPDGAIVAGHTCDGEPLYVGRAKLNLEEILVLGKVQRSVGCLCFPLDGHERVWVRYEVLIRKPLIGKNPWIPWCFCQGIPKGSVLAGNDEHGSSMYVGRAFYNGEYLPAKVIPSKKVASVLKRGEQIKIDHFEVLRDTGFSWVAGGCGSVPENARVVGKTHYGEPLYVGRTYYKGSLTLGKIHRSHECIYIADNDKVVRLESYEVLVEDSDDRGTSSQFPFLAIYE